ncbi:MAG: hypothetical protein A2W25_07075 [candidate division Zixibacteria bacterium RBG_16_53_22]|nr:MAG: hypothetical protein A2W25_07075 [candidate division Zixibacteria bacterium RBG_16_53_22]
MFAIENIPDNALDATLSTRGGRDIARQFAHMHMVRVWRLEATSKKLATGLERFEKGKSPDKKKLLKALEHSGEAVQRLSQGYIENAGKVANFKRGVIPTLAYLISHEAHHRGSILLTMKQSGFRLPDSLKWGIWDWNKFADKR